MLNIDPQLVSVGQMGKQQYTIISWFYKRAYEKQSHDPISIS